MPDALALLAETERGLSSLEAELLGASDDPGRFHDLTRKRGLLLREAERLCYAAKREEAEAAVQHKLALHERLSDCRNRAAEVAAEVAVEVAAMAGAIDQIVASAARVAKLSQAVESYAIREDQALTALHRAGEKVEVPRPTISPAPMPREVAARLHAASTAVLRAAGLTPNSPVALSAIQNFKLTKAEISDVPRT